MYLPIKLIYPLLYMLQLGDFQNNRISTTVQRGASLIRHCSVHIYLQMCTGAGRANLFFLFGFFLG